MTIDVLVVTGGHPFEPGPFFAMFDAFDDVTWTAGTAPQAGHDVVVLYDMPGFDFTGDPTDPVRLIEPTEARRAAVAALTSAGVGLVFLHHAIAGWPAWDDYGRLMGGRFRYQPSGGMPDSGYLLGVEHTIEVVTPDHPVCAGLPASFTLTDELYCYAVDEEAVTPLLVTTHPTTDEHFYSPDLAVRGRMNDRTGWHHPRGSNLVGWAREVDRSRLVYLQPGDGPAAHGDRNYRRLVQNAIRWTARSPASRSAALR